jgi:hypothetical protein
LPFRHLAVPWILAFCSCADHTPPQAVGARLLTSAVTEINIEVDYEQGAEPWFTPRGTGGKPWGLVRVNVDELLAEADIQTSIPESVDELEQIDGLGSTAYTDATIRDIAEKHRTVTGTSARPSVYIVFLDGFYANSAGDQTSVLAVTFVDEALIAVFVPALEKTGARAFIEQTTVIHELGHALGLVNAGIVAQSPHHDAAHGAHCSNEECVMHYLNEGGRELQQFVQRRQIEGNDALILFDDACLEDARQHLSSLGLGAGKLP